MWRATDMARHTSALLGCLQAIRVRPLSLRLRCRTVREVAEGEPMAFAQYRRFDLSFLRCAIAKHTIYPVRNCPIEIPLFCPHCLGNEIGPNKCSTDDGLYLLAKRVEFREISKTQSRNKLVQNGPPTESPLRSLWYFFKSDRWAFRT